MADLIATFNASTGWSGKTITYEDGQFILEGQGPVTPADVLRYADQAQLQWARPELGDWVRQVAAGPATPAAHTAAAGTATEQAGAHGADAVSTETEAQAPAVAPLVRPPAQQPPPSSVPASGAGPSLQPVPMQADSLCPVCRQASLQATTVKGGLSGRHHPALLCPVCGATLVQDKGDASRFKLDKTHWPSLPAWKIYAHKMLSVGEWRRIAGGGDSDEEQADLDLHVALDRLRQGRVPITSGQEVPILLKAGERALFVCDGITLREPRSVTTGYYGGPSLHVAKGLTLRTGAFRTQSHEELKEIDRGKLVLTSKRLVFAGARRTVEAALPKLTAVEAYSDAIAIRRTGKAKTEVFLGLDRGAYTFTVEGRTHSEPFSGLILKYAIEGLLAQGG